MKDKVVIITGGSSGIGKALAKEFGSHGSKILITGRNAQDLDAAVAELKQNGIEVFGFQSDVSREDDNNNMALAAIQKYGRIDIIINNAGISMRALFEEVGIDVIRKVMEINFY